VRRAAAHERARGRGAATRVLAVAALALALGAAAQPAWAVPSAAELSTNHRANPLGVDDREPRLSWTLRADRRDEAQTAAQVQDATSVAALERGDALWDSGRHASGEPWLDWAGPELRSGTRYHWREAVGFGVAQLTDGARRSRDGARGYTSDPPRNTRDAEEWVRVDLGAQRRAGAAVLWPRTQTPSDGELQVDGVCFPEDFTVEVSDDGAQWREVARVRGQGNPGRSPLVVDLGGATARHVRVLVTRLGKPIDFEDDLRVYRLQLAELEVLAARPEVTQ
jgi:hypothetical protein